jgi:hypothetical protein
MFVCCECRVFSGRGLCNEVITRPEESYRLWCVVVCDLETSRIDAACIHDISSRRVIYVLRILVNNQLKAQYFFLIYLFQFSTVSSTPVLIIRRMNCINTTFGMSLWNKWMD